MKIRALRQRIHAKRSELQALAAELGEAVLVLDQMPDRPSNRRLAKEMLGVTEGRYRSIVRAARRRRQGGRSDRALT